MWNHLLLDQALDFAFFLGQLLGEMTYPKMDIIVRVYAAIGMGLTFRLHLSIEFLTSVLPPITLHPPSHAEPTLMQVLQPVGLRKSSAWFEHLEAIGRELTSRLPQTNSTSQAFPFLLSAILQIHSLFIGLGQLSADRIKLVSQQMNDLLGCKGSWELTERQRMITYSYQDRSVVRG
jgi:hypothetical protein